MIYDPEHAPDPTSWAAASDAERLAAIEAHHGQGAAPSREARIHVALHHVVENQVATGTPPEVRGALDRLVSAGRSRHDALHAIGAIAAEALRAALAGGRFDAAAYATALDRMGRARE